MNEVIEMACAHCGRPVTLTNTPSLTRPDGTRWPIYHGACWQTHNRKKKRK